MSTREDLWFVRFDLLDPIGNRIPIPKVFQNHLCTYNYDAVPLLVTPLNSFIIYKGPDGGQEDCWFPSAAGLETVRGLLTHYRRRIEWSPLSSESQRNEWTTLQMEKIAPLEALEALLEEARGAEFFIAHRD